MSPEAIILNCFVGALLWAGVAWLVAAVGRRTPPLRPWGLCLQSLVVVWLAFGVFRCDIDEIPDSVTHFDGATHVCKLLEQQDYAEFWRHAGGGNQGFQFLLGIALWLFPAGSRLVNMVNAAVGFTGMLLVLEYCCRHASLRRAPAWLVGGTVLLPTAVWWSCNINKEAWALLGIALMQRATLALMPGESPDRRYRSGLLGLLIVGFLRPHIAMAWLFGVCGAIVIATRNVKIGAVCVAAVATLVALIPFWRPDVAQILSSTSLLEAMSQGYEVRVESDIGASAIQRTGPILPVITGVEVIFLRPLPADIYNAAMWCAGIEIWAVTSWCLLGVIRNLPRLRLASNPPLLAALLAVLALSFFFSYMPYLGYTVRQRLQVFPALIAIAALPRMQTRGWVSPARKSGARANSDLPFRSFPLKTR